MRRKNEENCIAAVQDRCRKLVEQGIPEAIIRHLNIARKKVNPANQPGL